MAHRKNNANIIILADFFLDWANVILKWHKSEENGIFWGVGVRIFFAEFFFQKTALADDLSFFETLRPV